MAVKLHRKETTTLPELAWVSNTPNLCSYLVLTSPLFWTFLNSTYIWNRAVQPWGTLDYRWFHMDHLYVGGFSSTPCLIFHPFSVLPWISQFCCWVNSAIKSHKIPWNWRVSLPYIGVSALSNPALSLHQRKTSSTFCAVLAEVSLKIRPNGLENMEISERIGEMFKTPVGGQLKGVILSNKNWWFSVHPFRSSRRSGWWNFSGPPVIGNPIPVSHTTPIRNPKVCPLQWRQNAEHTQFLMV